MASDSVANIDAKDVLLLIAQDFQTVFCSQGQIGGMQLVIHEGASTEVSSINRPRVVASTHRVVCYCAASGSSDGASG